MLALPGFIEAHRFDPSPTQDDRVVHTVQYVLSDQQALDRYLEEHAERMRAPGVALFGEDLRSSRQVRAMETRSETSATSCLNCGVEISGQYCWNCGQRSNTRLISLFELIRDAFGDMFELDSRLWRTMIPLAIRPGYLTAEYLRGRRARYMPPFRMYLVMSFIFFLLTTAFTESSAIDESVDDEVRITGLSIGADGVNLRVGDGDPEPEDDATLDNDNELPTDADALAEAEEEIPCEADFDEIGMPWLNRYITERRAEAICDHIKDDNGQRFTERFTQNLAVGALALLPLLAMLLKFLYPLSRRYYVEHLLMLVHYHSFLFFAASILFSYNSLLSLTTAPSWLYLIPNLLIGLYIPIYLYKALRNVYQQGRVITLFKYVLLFAGYLTAVVIIIVTMVLYIFATY